MGTPQMSKFPITTRTRAGSEVTLVRYDKENDRPWVGRIKTELSDATYMQPYSWLPNGSYHSEETPRSLDIIIPNEVQV